MKKQSNVLPLLGKPGSLRFPVLVYYNDQAQSQYYKYFIENLLLDYLFAKKRLIRFQPDELENIPYFYQRKIKFLYFLIRSKL